MARGNSEFRNKRKVKRKDNKKHPYKKGGKFRSSDVMSKK